MLVRIAVVAVASALSLIAFAYVAAAFFDLIERAANGAFAN